MSRHFIDIALSDPKVGAIASSSPHLVRRVQALVPTTTKTIIEYGSGSGVMTRTLLENLPHDGHLYAIESNPEFATNLQTIADPRLTVITAPAEAVAAEPHRYGIHSVDVVISSIPFSFLKPETRRLLVTHTHELLKPGGICIVFHQYIPLAKRELQIVFGNSVTIFEWKNLFPCFVFVAKKT